ncbi:MAG: response regulator transcription factor, partial [Actinomycetales bacterium]|nr:response regulator transcription factor [Actinomycetales bacterium]
MSSIRVVIADDQDLIRGGLRAILDADESVTVVGEAANGREAARVAREERADVVLMDVQMPGSDGIEGVSTVLLARPEARVLMLTMFDLDEYVFGALRAGASGFLLKTTPPEQLVAAIHAVHSGDLLFAPTVTRRLVEAYVRRPPVGTVPEIVSSLTDRELEVLRAMAKGLSNAEIGRELFLGEAT